MEEWRVMEISDVPRRIWSTFIGRRLNTSNTIPNADLKRE